MKITITGTFDNTKLEKSFDKVRYFNSDRVRGLLIEISKFKLKTISNEASNENDANTKFIITLYSDTVLTYHLNYNLKNSSEFLDTFGKLVKVFDNFIYNTPSQYME